MYTDPDRVNTSPPNFRAFTGTKAEFHLGLEQLLSSILPKYNWVTCWFYLELITYIY